MGAAREDPFPGGVGGAVVERRAGELRLARYRRSRDRGERDALFALYLPLARGLAARYRHTSEGFEDLLQVASIGLLKAIERYDAGRGYAFSSFAVPTILGELRRHLRDHTWSVHVPRDLQELGQRVRAVGEELSCVCGREATVAELAVRVGRSEEDVLDAREAMAAHSPVSLDEPVGGGREPVARGDLLGGEDGGLGRVEDGVLLAQYLGRLPARSREVLRLRFELDLKQREIGARLGISQMQVSRLLGRSLERLRALVAEEDARTDAAA